MLSTTTEVVILTGMVIPTGIITVVAAVLIITIIAVVTTAVPVTGSTGLTTTMGRVITMVLETIIISHAATTMVAIMARNALPGVNGTLLITIGEVTAARRPVPAYHAKTVSVLQEIIMARIMVVAGTMVATEAEHLIPGNQGYSNPAAMITVTVADGKAEEKAVVVIPAA
jgi:hypothetical protein